MTTVYAGRGKLIFEDSIYNGEGGNVYNGGLKNNSEFVYFNASIYPEFTYFVTSKTGLYLAMGEIEYSMIDWKSDNSSWIVNFNPINWKLGIKFKI